MSLKTSLIISVFFHLSVFGINFLKLKFFPPSNTVSMQIQKGKNRIYQTDFISFKLTGQLNQINSSNSSSTDEGAQSDEIKKIQNKIAYPPLALENGWEAECEWIVVIGRERRIAKVDPIRKCKYQIFEKEFLRVINDWNFNLPEDTVLKIPVTFRIQRE